MKKLILLVFAIVGLAHAMPGQLYPKSFLEGKEKVIIPFEYHHHFIVVPIRFQGMLPVRFIFDTGSEYSILFKKVYADILGLLYQKRIPILGADQGQAMSALVSRNVRLDLEGCPPVVQDILVLEQDLFNLEQLTGTPIDGILGTNFFRNFILEIDYRKQRLILRNPEGYTPPKKHEEVAVHFKNNKPYTTGLTEIFRDTSLALELLFDTGAGLPLLLHNNSHPDLKLPEKTITGRIGMGLGGMMKGYIGRIRTLDVGPFTFSELITTFQDIDDPLVENETKSRNGLIGNQLLSKFNIIIDFPRNRMYLRPTRFYKKKIRFDRSGMTLFAVGVDLRQYVVQDVVSGSAADLAGIQTGDRITRVGFWPVSWFTLDRLNWKLQRKPGTRVRLEVLRAGKKLKKVLYLKDLL